MDAILNSTFFNYATVAVGLGFVIFIHELGHFLVAKWCKVKVEAFALGFGPPLLSYRKGLGVRIGSTRRAYEQWLAERGAASPENPPAGAPAMGETEYSIRAIPLGGFVKMLGEGEEADSENVRTTDPRAYPNKPVSQRMAIISAGVIMNIVSGLIFFAIAYGRGGLLEEPALIRTVVAGDPAYNAGIRSGDEILAIDGKGDIDFTTLRRVTAMSGSDQVLNLSVRRPGVAEPLSIPVEPQRRANAQMKQMGIAPAESIVLAQPPFVAPAGLDDPGAIGAVLQVDDRVIAAGPEGAEPTPVADIFEFHDLLAKNRDVPLTIVVERGSYPPGTIDNPNVVREPLPQVRTTLPVMPFVDLGFRLEMGPVAAVRPGSPAARADFRVGDRILGVEGLEVLDPFRLPDFLYAHAGEPIAFQVSRSEGGKPEETLTLTATPEPFSTWLEPHASHEPLDLAELGLAYTVGRTIAAVDAGSPAALAGLEAGRTIDAVILTPPAISSDAKAPQPVTRSLNPDSDTVPYGWPAIWNEIQHLPRHAIGIRVAGVDKAYQFVPAPADSWNNPDRGLLLQPLRAPMPPMSVAAALSRGLQETRQTVGEVYAMFRSLFLGLISPKMLGGPIMIVGVASQSARAGVEAFLLFLGMLSMNLAVINFLPIPPLDGGQMTFLIAEMFRGRPLPERALSAGTLFGLVLVLMLMVFVFYQDIMRFVIG